VVAGALSHGFDGLAFVIVPPSADTLPRGHTPHESSNRRRVSVPFPCGGCGVALLFRCRCRCRRCPPVAATLSRRNRPLGSARIYCRPITSPGDPTAAPRRIIWKMHRFRCTALLFLVQVRVGAGAAVEHRRTATRGIFKAPRNDL
jgi:hypothetical protein